MPPAEEKEARSVQKTWNYPGMVITALLLLPKKMGTLAQVRDIKLDLEKMGGAHGTTSRWKIQLSRSWAGIDSSENEEKDDTHVQLVGTTQADFDAMSPSSGAKKQRRMKMLQHYLRLSESEHELGKDNAETRIIYMIKFDAPQYPACNCYCKTTVHR